MMWLIYIAILLPVLLYILRWAIIPILDDRSHPHALTYTHTYITSKPKGKASGSVSFPSIYDTASVYLSLIVPAYNEEERLDIMMEDTIRYLSSRAASNPSFTYEIIIVDDGSRDRTSEIAVTNWVQKLGSDVVRVLTLKQNQGKGGAVQQGMLHARGEYLLMVDADGATRIDDFTQVESELKRVQTPNGYGVAVGSRSHLETDAVAKRKWYRNILMYGFHFLVSTLCVSGVRDTQCGFKLFTRPTAQILFANQHLRRWCFDVELLFLARRFSMPIIEVCVNWQEIPGSKIRLIESSLLMGRDLVIIRGSYTTGIWKYSGDVAKWKQMAQQYAARKL